MTAERVHATDERCLPDEASLLAGQVLRSPYAHARIVEIDARRAKALPGVVAVLISDDVLDTDPYHGLYLEDRPLLAIDRVRCVGEPVAAAAAEDAAIATHALSLIDVTYEALPAAPTIEAALSDAAPRLHVTELLRPGILHDASARTGHPGNVCWQQTLATGDVAAALGAADLTVEGEYQIAARAPVSVESPPIVAQWTDEALTIWTAVPSLFLVQAKLARIFGLPIDHVQIRRANGDAPGGDAALIPVAAALARKARRPVRLDSPDDVGSSSGARVWMQTAATEHGHLLVREVRVELDLGAFAGDRPLRIAPEPVLGPYRWQAVAFAARGIYTTTSPGVASPLLPAVGEIQVDEIARRLGRDASDVRAQSLLAGISTSMPPASMRLP